MFFVGADGCKAGWFAVLLSDAAEWETLLFRDIRSLWRACGSASLVLLDIPIGLLKRPGSMSEPTRSLLWSATIHQWSPESASHCA